MKQEKFIIYGNAMQVHYNYYKKYKKQRCYDLVFLDIARHYILYFSQFRFLLNFYVSCVAVLRN